MKPLIPSGTTAAMAACCLACASAPVQAAESVRKSYDIAPGDAAGTLKRFAEDSGRQVVFLVDAVRGITTNAVRGEYTVREALARLVADTGLVVVEDAKSGALMVNRLPREAPPSKSNPKFTADHPSKTMKSKTPFAIVSSILALALTPATSSGAQPGGPVDETVQLPQFNVSSTKADSYRATEALSLARIKGAILDTPVSISVVTRELMEDLGANSSWDAARYMPGVANGRGSGTNGGIQDRMNFRGFESATRTVDNFTQTQIPGTQAAIDTIEPEYIERVEIVMGPNAILNPTGTPGGSTNIVTKMPLFQRQAGLKLTLGNYSAQKASFDLTGPVTLVGNGKKLAYRLIGTAQDTDTYIPGGFEKWTVGAMLLYQLTPTSQLSLKYIGVDFKAYENASAPNDNGWLIYEPTSIRGATLANEPRTAGVTYNGRNGVNVNSITVERTNTVHLLYTGTIAKIVSMRLGGQLHSHNNVGDSAYPDLGPTSNAFDPATGAAIGVPAYNPNAVPVVWRYNKGIGVMHSFQNDYAANLTPGDLMSLQLVGGWAHNHNHTFPTRTGTAPMPAVNMFTGAGLEAPRPDLKTSFTFGNRNESQATLQNAYTLAKAGFFADRVFLTSGATRIFVKTETYSRNAITGNLASKTYLKDNKDAYIGSLLVKPTKNTSVYYTYSTNANLVTFNSGNGVSQPLWSEGKQHEYGVKTEFLNQRLAVNLTHFKMEQTNQTSPNPLANTNPLLAGNILSDNTSKGWEISAIGGLTKNISVIASYTNMEYRDFLDRRVRNVPDSFGNALVRYSFTEGPLKDLSLFAAYTYFGDAPGETITALAPAPSPGAPRLPAQPGFYTAAWHVINAGAAYRHGQWTYNLNVENLENRKFGWQPASRLTISPYPGFTWRLTTGVRF